MNNNGKISKIWMSLIGILFCVSVCKADNDFTFETDKITPVEFKTNKIVSDGIEMPYRVAHINGTGKPSLVIYLHGGSSKGNDNEKQMNEAGIDSITNYLESRQIDAIYLVPQCPSDKSWEGPMLGVLKSLIDKYVGDGIVDKNSVYIFGGSMGGTGTWSMLSAYPGLFAAAMPVAGNPSKCDADKVASTPVFTVMGTSDRIMSVETTSDFINELNARNGITRFEIEEGWTHEMTCIQSYTTHRLDWVFSHGSNSSGIENTMADKKVIESMQYYSIEGRALSEPPSKGLYIVRWVNNDGSVTALKKLN